MRIGLTLVVLLVAAALLAAQESWQTKRHLVLVDGNELYSRCQSYERNVRVTEGHVEFTGEAADLISAGQCWGYVFAVVDSIPEGEGFDPDSSVRGNQEIDVAIKYLQDHPEIRPYGAYSLVRMALTQAFPATTKR
jgi:hypothetical protein